MYRRAIGMVMAGWLATTGCDSLPFIGGGDEAPADTAAQVAAEPAATPEPTPAAAEPAPATPASPEPAPVQQPAPVAQAPAERPVMQAEELWAPILSGTVSPGMSRADVVAAWGDPVAESASGGRTYLYFRNGCEVSCGTFDVVFLENDQVVDAIVRAGEHAYSGQSSSPPGQEALPTLPGGTAN